MTSFSDSTFNASLYSDFRPSYPPKLYSILTDYHKGPKNLLVDQGCGPGTASIPFTKLFAHVIGSDPSAGMIDVATKNAAAKEIKNIEFKVSAAEDLSYINPGTADMIVASQAAHWFQHDKWFKECAKTLRPGGTLSFFGYLDHQYMGAPQANKIIEEFSYGKDYLGPYWEPGRQVLRNLFRDIEVPKDIFEDIERIEYIPGKYPNDKHLIGKKMTLAANEQYVRTWSSFHNYNKQHKEVSRVQGGGGDIVDRLFDRLKKTMGWTENKVLEIQWSHIIVLARRI
ncbi:S-adenosyl-L-methionine-dependent methyltransferase [Myxozyma melibiosi]|uniref:S-adenosyl-L-methionine-dependent methyltransferase n=1 Tax=Myxozyma melibiosi TaxID=54550 RepID=A0ABR1FFK2_9ASCO